MSLKSWKEEFYSVNANRVSIKNSGEHVERKWVGLSKKNIKKHNGKKVKYQIIFDDGFFNVGDLTCAWCCIAYKKNTKAEYFHSYACGFCPAVQSGIRLCTDRNTQHSDSPLEEFLYNNRIREMLTWIRQARKLIEKKAKK